MSHPGVDETQLLREMANGSIAAFAQFYEQYAALVLHIAMRIVGDQMEAEDICHDIFLEVWKKADQYDPQRGSVEAWLAVKARTRALDRLRRSQRVALTPSDPPGITTPTIDVPLEERVFSRLEREALLCALRKIPTAQAQAVHGAYCEAQSHRELAAKMKRPLGTVKSLIRYGLDNLRKQLSQLGWLEPSGGAKKHE